MSLVSNYTPSSRQSNLLIHLISIDHLVVQLLLLVLFSQILTTFHIAYLVFMIYLFSQITLETKFKEDLGLDSLDHVEIVMAIEDEFGKNGKPTT